MKGFLDLLFFLAFFNVATWLWQDGEIAEKLFIPLIIMFIAYYIKARMFPFGRSKN